MFNLGIAKYIIVHTFLVVIYFVEHKNSICILYFHGKVELQNIYEVHNFKINIYKKFYRKFFL